MTEHNPPPPSDDAELQLPGLTDEAPTGASPLELAARQTLAHLARERLLDDGHAVQCQLLLDLCRGYSDSVRAARGKVTVAASAVAAQIQSLLDSLPEPVTTPDGDGFDQLAEELREAAREAIAQLKP